MPLTIPEFANVLLYLFSLSSVAVLIFNSTRNAFVLVKQFRPAVFMSKHRPLWGNSEVFSNPLSQKQPDTDPHPPSAKTPTPPSLDDCDSTDAARKPAKYGHGSLGCTYELCAGIIDKATSLEQITKEEIIEETGYEVPIGNIELINSYYSSVGHSGSYQHLYYCEVTDSMLVSEGGGNDHEGEMIEVVYIPVEEGMKMVFDSEKPKSTGLCFAMTWFEHFKKNKT